MFVEYIYMNSRTPKRHAETLRNWNIPFQLKKRNTYRNGIDNLEFYHVIFDFPYFHFILTQAFISFRHPLCHFWLPIHLFYFNPSIHFIQEFVMSFKLLTHSFIQTSFMLFFATYLLIQFKFLLCLLVTNLPFPLSICQHFNHQLIHLIQAFYQTPSTQCHHPLFHIMISHNQAS